MKTFLTLLLLSAVSSFGAIIQNPMTTNRAAAYPSSGQAGVFNGTQWVFVSTNAFGGSGAASNAIANFTGLGTNTQFYATGTSNIVLDVIAQSLNTGTSSVTSVDWQSRILFGTDGITGISWGTGALVGNGSGLTNIQGSNIVGTISAGIAGIIPTNNLPQDGGYLTNVLSRGVTYLTNAFTSSSNTLTLGNRFLDFVMTEACAVTNVVGLNAGEYRWATLRVTNSTAGALYFYYTAPGDAIGAVTTNALSIASHKKAFLTVWSRDINETNYWNVAGQ